MPEDVTNREVPPKLRNGSVSPVIGNIPVATPMFNMA